MSLENPSNSKERRTQLHALYEPYAQGHIILPRGRVIGVEDESTPEKTKPIARALTRAWDEIDSHIQAYQALISYHIENSLEVLISQKGRGIVIGEIGRNAIVLSIFTPVDGKIDHERLLIGPRQVKDDFLDNFEVELADGRVVEAGFGDNLKPDVEGHILTESQRVITFEHFDARMAKVA